MPRCTISSLNCFAPEFDRERYSNMAALDLCHNNLTSVPAEIFRYEKSIEELYLDANQIRELPRVLFSLQNLKVLGLSDNELSVLPSAVANLVNLRELDISKNGIIDLPENMKSCKMLQHFDVSVNPVGKLPEGFTQLLNLTHLFLNDAFLDYLPGSFGRLAKLVVLELRENHLRSLPKSMSHLSQLERLDIGNNEFTELPVVVGCLINLKELWMDNNAIREIPPEIGLLRQLMFLDISKNRLEWLPPEIESLHSLTDVFLSNNLLVELPEQIGALGNLQLLKLDENHLFALPNAIGRLKSLEELVVSGNELETIPVSIGLLRNLRALNADENFLESIPAELGSCSALAILSLRENRLTSIPEDIGRMPNLQVINFATNRLENLPYTFRNLKKLKALWLAENQSKPLIPLQAEFNDQSQTHTLTCFMFPQKLETSPHYSEDEGSFQLSLFEEELRQRSSIVFDIDEDDYLARLAERYQTPYPKDARDKVRQARFLANKRKREQQQELGTDGELSSNQRAHNCHQHGRQPHSWQQQQRRPRALRRQFSHEELMEELQRQRQKEQKKKPPPYPGMGSANQQPSQGGKAGSSKPTHPREQAVASSVPKKVASQDSLGNMSAEEVSQRLEEIERLEQELRMREPPNPVLNRINNVPWYEQSRDSRESLEGPASSYSETETNVSQSLETLDSVQSGKSAPPVASPGRSVPPVAPPGRSVVGGRGRRPSGDSFTSQGPVVNGGTQVPRRTPGSFRMEPRAPLPPAAPVAVPPPKPPRLNPPLYQSPPPYSSPLDRVAPPLPPPNTATTQSSYSSQHSFREEQPSSASSIQTRPSRPPWSSSSEGTLHSDNYEDIHSFNEEEPRAIVNNGRAAQPPSYNEAVESSSGSTTPLSGSVLHIYDSSTLTRLKQGTVENRLHPRAIDNHLQGSQIGQGPVGQTSLPRSPTDIDDDVEDYGRASHPLMIRLKGEGQVVEASDSVGLRFNSSADANRFEDRLRQLQLERSREGRNMPSNGYGEAVRDRGGHTRVSESPRSSVSSQPGENEGPPIEPPPSETLTVEIHKDPSNPVLGFSIAGGTDATQPNPYDPSDPTSIYVTKVQTDGPAALDMKVGDKLIEVNNIKLRKVTHDRAALYLKHCQVASLTIQRRTDLPQS